MIDLITAMTLTVIIVEAIKRTNRINETYLPFVAMLVGIVLVAITGTADVLTIIGTGIIAGLQAVGLYEATKVGYGLVKK
jgi:hypothetical protein